MASNIKPLPIDCWLADMTAAIDRIAELGTSILNTHRLVSDEAAAAADRWHLAERMTDECEALRSMVESVRQIIVSIDECRNLLHEDRTARDDLHQAMNRCADTIDARLPGIEQAFATIRRAALDLLQWTQRSARLDSSTLPSEYRASYARLLAHTPVFKPRMAAFQEDLLVLNQEPQLHPEVQRLISSISRYHAAIDTARRFVQSVVEPPLELVFHETQAFLNDFQSLPPEQMTELATELNDCCQRLLYDPAEFRLRVEYVRTPLAGGLDSSMVVLTLSNDYKVIFTVDEDPVFEQLAITLFRVLPESQYAAAKDELTRVLYEHFSSE